MTTSPGVERTGFGESLKGNHQLHVFFGGHSTSHSLWRTSMVFGTNCMKPQNQTFLQWWRASVHMPFQFGKLTGAVARHSLCPCFSTSHTKNEGCRHMQGEEKSVLGMRLHRFVKVRPNVITYNAATWPTGRESLLCFSGGFSLLFRQPQNGQAAAKATIVSG